MLYFDLLAQPPSEAPAIIFHEESYTFGQARSKVRQWAAFLQQQGLKPGERVGLFSKNSSSFVLAYFAVIQAGGIIVPFNYQLAMPEVAYIIKDADIRFMLVAQELPLTEALQECGYEGTLGKLLLLS